MSTTLERTKEQRSYKPRDVEAGLQACAALGNAVAASERTGIPHSTLTYWCREAHRDRYMKIREDLAPIIHAQVAAQTEDMLLEISDAKREALTRFRSEIPRLAGKDASAAVKNLSIAEANSIDKVLLLRGKPTSIIETHNVDVLLRKLQAGGIVTVEAEEITEQEAEALAS